ncbi:MAG: SIS domain-containing protein [Gammaproteobacteria bacterium]|nr:SIS domain-containing protein [Gammaproteobacteria bacterium]
MTTDCLLKIKPNIISLDMAITDFATVLSNAKMTTLSHESLPTQQGMQAILTILVQCRANHASVYIVGNGGSAAIASHAVIDFINMCGMRATAMLDPAVTTCISNDYGYEHIYAKQLARFIRTEDILIAISSSGKSENIINAVNAAKKLGAKIITLSGFSENNPLRQIGDYNIWLNSTDYGQVEIGHAFMLHYITDRLKEGVAEIFS